MRSDEPIFHTGAFVDRRKRTDDYNRRDGIKSVAVGEDARMSQHYGRPLNVTVADGKLTIEIGIHTLAHAVSYADWANPWNGHDYVRTFAITDPEEFARDVCRAMQHEQEDGSTPLSDFLDKMTEAALDDGSMGADYEQHIKHGEFSSAETWAVGIDPTGDRP